MEWHEYTVTVRPLCAGEADLCAGQLALDLFCKTVKLRQWKGTWATVLDMFCKTVKGFACQWKGCERLVNGKASSSEPRVRRDRVTPLLFLSPSVTVIVTFITIINDQNYDQDEKLAPTRTIMMALVTTIADG